MSTEPTENAPAPAEEHKGFEPPPDMNENNSNPEQRRFFNQRFNRGRGGPRGGFGGRFNNGRGRGRGFGRGGGPRKDDRDRGHNDGDQMEFQQNYRYEDKFFEKLAQIGGPAVDLPPLDITEKKYSGRHRLYIGNLPDVNEDELKELLAQYGDCGELFLNKEKSFAFAKFDYMQTSEKVKRELEGFLLKGKNLKIRNAPIIAAVKVKNLSNFVSNELLFHAFSVFGEVERAVVLVDERGRSTGEGIVEFARKGFAQNAIRKCGERCFFITESLRPVIVEPYEHINDADGCPEKYLPKRNPDYLKARSKGPRMADLDSFEHDYGLRWKQLLELYAQKEEALKKELAMEKEKLDAQMEYARYEHETDLLREQLRAREMDRDRQKQEWEMKERQVEDHRRRNEEQVRRHEENLATRRQHQDEEMRRRQQENNLFMQAHQLHNMLDEQEQAFQKPDGEDREQSNDGNEGNNMGGGGGPGNMAGGGGPGNMGGGGGPGPGPGPNRGGFRRDRWVTDRRDDFVPKRRRF